MWVWFFGRAAGGRDLKPALCRRSIFDSLGSRRGLDRGGSGGVVWVLGMCSVGLGGRGRGVARGREKSGGPRSRCFEFWDLHTFESRPLE